jgi:gas vesicle structural protein
MTTAIQPGGGGGPSPTGLAEVIDTILDKGLVIDAYVRVSLVGIEVLTIDARVVVASVDTYLRFAEAVNRLDLNETEEGGVPELIEDMREGGAKDKTKGAAQGVLEAAGEKVRDFTGDQGGKSSARRRRRAEEE